MAQLLHFAVEGKAAECKIVAGYNAGYTGRNQQAVQAHIDELAGQGISPPGNIPTLFSVPSYMNLQIDRVEVEHPRTSGEVEWAIVHQGNGKPTLLTVASDHTDRALEAHDVTSAKQISPNVLGSQAWVLERLSDEIDAIVMRSRVFCDGKWTVLQEGQIGDLIHPLDQVNKVAELDRLKPGVVMLGGTLPMIDPQKQFAERWEVSLERPNGESITKSYSVHRMKTSIN